MKISIITITYNDAPGLKKTLDSVAQQSCQDFEHIVIDGGSTDGSVDIIKQYPHVVKWVSEKDTGIYNAMNKGIRLATGDYCLFMNGGDWFYDEQAIANVYAANPVEDVVVGNAIFEASKYVPEEKVVPPDTLRASDLLLHYLPHQAAFIKREVFERIHLYDESYKIISDWLFFAEALINEKCSYRHIPVWVACCESEGMSNNPKFRERINAEHQRGESTLFPMLYNDYQELRAARQILRSPAYRMQTRFFSTFVGRVICKIMKWLDKV